MCCEREYRDIKNSTYFLLRSDRDSEEACNKRGLSNDIVLWYPSNLTFADHVDGFDALNGAPRRLKGSKSLTGSHTAFDRAVILLHDII